MKKVRSKLNRYLTKIQDIVVTDFIYLLPCAIRWFYRKLVRNEIVRHGIGQGPGRKASIYQHGRFKSPNQEVLATLILHGLYSHPFVMLHLADMAQETGGGPVFSLYLSYDEIDHDGNRLLIKQTVDFIEKTVRDSGHSLGGVVLVGHSMGAIEAAYRAFVDLDTRVISVISIAGRLRDPDFHLGQDNMGLRRLVDKINKGVIARPELPLYQIVGGKDWNASLESMVIRPHEGYFHVIEDAMHFNILFHKEIRKVFLKFLNDSFVKD